MAGGDRRFLQALGRRIAKLRQEQGLTKVRVTELLAVSQQLVAS